MISRRHCKSFSLAAEQGDALAQSNLGVMYETGNGASQDNAEAVRWYWLAVEQGEALAQGNLGRMHADGFGVSQDYVTAHIWFNIAAANGCEQGIELRSSIATSMTPDQIAEAQRRARVCMSSECQDCE